MDRRGAARWVVVVATLLRTAVTLIKLAILGRFVVNLLHCDGHLAPAAAYITGQFAAHSYIRQCPTLCPTSVQPHSQDSHLGLKTCG